MAQTTPPVEGDINKIIASAVNARVEAAVLAALSGDEVIGKLVIAALSEQVPATNDRYDSKKTTYINRVLRDSIKEATADALRRVIAEELPTIEEEIRKELRRKVKQIAEGLATQLGEKAASAYGVKVELMLPERY